jgi:hypothetical protein
MSLRRGVKSLFRAILQKADLVRPTSCGLTSRGLTFKAIPFEHCITKRLEPEQMTAAQNWNLAYYDSNFLAQLGLPPDHNETLPGKLEELRKQAEQEAAKSGNN